jgi:5'-deoxynucleotidase
MSHFFAYISRMHFIQRWSLMHNVHAENIQEHTAQVCMIAHTLALIRNRKFGGNINPERVTVLALYHDASEVITGDLPTPIKYFNPKIKEAYKEIESVANRKLFDLLPELLRPDFDSLFFPEEAEAEAWGLVKAADKLAAYIKCLEERKAGNREFAKAELVVRNTLKSLNMPEVDWFLKEFIPSMKLTLDELD